ncbi:hypothetical protein HYALB_00010966 [Hymenoscyphus albidus]|uniref:Glycoside hydrolase family 2 protein n=1 Tax=Hymenoscyphus albidus TaxID=595503 RepID=A0A9N9LNP0_9HELO|nr:hypothetical protein HYALB_00010966 [Hymenoscyphus albidus]
MDYISSISSTAMQGKAKMASQHKPANPLSYPQSKQPFSSELFKNPTSEYRGCPLWSWNTKLDKDQLLRQIDNFEAMGLGGFHIHVRIGLDTEYLGDEFMELVKACVDYAESKNMLACLYDEDRWPSGAAGGLVTKKYPEHKGKHLLFTPHLYGTVPLGGERSPSSARACRSENGHLIATYDITLDENGCLKSSKLLNKGESGVNIWYLYEETNPGSAWFNDQTYVDTLSTNAMAKFIEMTHEVYKSKVGDKFGTVVPCIFTDEPQFAIKTTLSNPRAGEDVFLPWTTDLAETLKKHYSTNIIEDLPQLVWNLPEGKPSVSRYNFHDHVCERFVSSFMDQIAQWCKKNGLMLNGHMMEEPTLYSQTSAIGEAMRCYRSMEMPGMDLLCDWTEYNTAKQVSSVARQNGLRGAMCEIYGVTHWTFTFQDHKGCGDWQAALGITFRVHHLTWLSMAGEGKRDYPASIGYQSPWFKEYSYIENHFARVGVALTRGKAVTRIAVIHPIESYWLAWGPNGPGNERDERERAFGDLTHWLLHGLLDFDFIAESLLPEQVSGSSSGKKLHVGACEYDVVIVPNLRTIRSTTLKVLQAFSKAGGKVIIAGSAPELVDAKVPETCPSLGNIQNVFWGRDSILSSLEPWREIRIFNDQGVPADNLLHQIRQDGDIRFVFVCNRDRENPVQTVIKLKGEWAVENMDTLAGIESKLLSHVSDGWTILPYNFEGCASLLIRLSPTSTSGLGFEHLTITTPSNGTKIPEISGPLQIAAHATETLDVKLESLDLSEPNVLLLDYAEFKLDDGEWSGLEEVLRIDNIIRSRLNIPPKGGAWRQPWTISEEDRAPRAHVSLRFTFESAFEILDSTALALEGAKTTKVTINGYTLHFSEKENPYWVDESITALEIPINTIKKGSNTVILEFSFGILTNIERIYLLGSFAVDLNGRNTSLRPLYPGHISWGNIAEQGFPFYVGNVTYHCSYSAPSKSNATLKVSNFSSPVVTVHAIDTNTKIGTIALQPRTLSLGEITPGTHHISITAFGNRYNSFGHIHLPEYLNLCGPDLWRTGGDWWTDDYSLRAIGVLDCPSIETSELAIEQPPIAKAQGGDEEWVLIKKSDRIPRS